MSPSTSGISDARLQAALSYWQSKTSNGRLPRRADIDPSDIPQLLPHIRLVDVLGAGIYRYRLIGTEIARVNGTDHTGRYVHDVIPAPYLSHVIALYDQCSQERRAIYTESLFFSPRDRAPDLHTKALFMPLSEDGDGVNIIFGAQVYLHIDRTLWDQHFIGGRDYKEIVHDHV